jgi:integrase/recombinase XerD
MSSLLEAFREYLQINKALRPESISAYMGDLFQFSEFVDGRLTEAGTEDVLRFLSLIDNKRTLNRKLSSINAFYRFCDSRELLTKQIKIPMARLPANLPKYLSYSEIMEGISKIDRSKAYGLRDYALILFLYASGCRISEALEVQKKDIVDGWLKIRYAKGEKERMVPLAPAATEAINEWLKQKNLNSSYLWTNARGEPLSRVSGYKIVKKYLGVSPHVLRHSFASAMILGGADLRVVQELLGHSSLLTTQIYTHIEKEQLRQTVTRYHPMRQNSTANSAFLHGDRQISSGQKQ